MTRGSWIYLAVFFALPLALLALAAVALDESILLVILALSWLGLGVVFLPVLFSATPGGG